MKKPLTIISHLVAITTAFVLLLAPGGTAFAQEAECTPPSPTDNGVHWPTGSDAGTFVYQCDGAYAGKWVNAYYVYNPATNSRTALYSPNYTYDCSAKQWHKTVWNFSAATGSYYKSTVTTSDPGGIATGCPLPDPPAPTTNTTDPTGTTSTTNSLAKSEPGGDPSGTNLSGSNNVGVNNNTTATMQNGIVSFADTGEALVTGNTGAGNAASGDAQVIANVINMLQSSSNVLTDPNILTFTANINGDVNGDLLLDPTKLAAMQPANSAATLDNNVKVNNSTDAAIINDIDLAAQSGDAAITSNTSAGSATSGTADAVANVVNVLNSAVTAGQSFVGVININGNLNGDILLPPGFIDTLLASNVPRYTVSTAAINNDVTVNNNTNQSIKNAIDAGATTGTATVADNTNAGSATSGAAKTNLTVFNLTGSEVDAGNDILVFVNVLGTWYGLIMNAPAGTTAASLGSGVTGNTTVNNTAELNNDTDQAIINNIKVAAKSGDASVTQNTKAGDATTGDATASVNLMNMINSRLTLNGWFGLLFINVFGMWNGSFGIDTAAGDPVLHLPAPTHNTSNTPAAPVFRFVPSSNGGGSIVRYDSTTSSSSTTPPAPGVVLAATHKVGNLIPSTEASSVVGTIHRNLTIYFLGAGLAIAILLFGERNRLLRRR